MKKIKQFSKIHHTIFIDVMEITSDMILKASALISTRSQSKSRHSMPDTSTKYR